MLGSVQRSAGVRQIILGLHFSAVRMRAGVDLAAAANAIGVFMRFLDGAGFTVGFLDDGSAGIANDPGIILLGELVGIGVDLLVGYYFAVELLMRIGMSAFALHGLLAAPAFIVFKIVGFVKLVHKGSAFLEHLAAGNADRLGDEGLFNMMLVGIDDGVFPVVFDIVFRGVGMQADILIPANSAYIVLIEIMVFGVGVFPCLRPSGHLARLAYILRYEVLHDGMGLGRDLLDLRTLHFVISEGSIGMRALISAVPALAFIIIAMGLGGIHGLRAQFGFQTAVQANLHVDAGVLGVMGGIVDGLALLAHPVLPHFGIGMGAALAEAANGADAVFDHMLFHYGFRARHHRFAGRALGSMGGPLIHIHSGLMLTAIQGLEIPLVAIFATSASTRHRTSSTRLFFMVLLLSIRIVSSG